MPAMSSTKGGIICYLVKRAKNMAIHQSAFEGQLGFIIDLSNASIKQNQTQHPQQLQLSANKVTNTYNAPGCFNNTFRL